MYYLFVATEIRMYYLSILMYLYLIIVPGPPLRIKAAALTGESILVSWLSPKQPNGRISLYTIYCREAGRVGTHTSYNLRMEDIVLEQGLTYEIRSLKEHQLYEFWVSKCFLNMY